MLTDMFPSPGKHPPLTLASRGNLDSPSNLMRVFLVCGRKLLERAGETQAGTNPREVSHRSIEVNKSSHEARRGRCGGPIQMNKVGL